MIGDHGRLAILERLRKGPLPANEYEGLAASGSSLNVMIHRLRKDGYEIVLEPDLNRRRKDGEPHGKCGVYVLKYEPMEGINDG